MCVQEAVPKSVQSAGVCEVWALHAHRSYLAHSRPPTHTLHSPLPTPNELTPHSPPPSHTPTPLPEMNKKVYKIGVKGDESHKATTDFDVTDKVRAALRWAVRAGRGSSWDCTAHWRACNGVARQAEAGSCG